MAFKMFRLLGTKRNRRCATKTARRKGAATVELAVTMPIIFLLAMGSIEAASMTFLRQALVQSAYETVKEAVKTNGTQANALVRGQQVLDFRNITGEQVTFDPINVADADRGTPVTVQISAPGDANTVFPFQMFSGQTITVRATMLKE